MQTGDREGLQNRVCETARRLRLIQVDFADDSEQTRRQYLREEIERALKTVLPEQRKVFLEQLMERFPAGHLDIVLAGEHPQVQGSPETAVKELKDPELIVSRLLEMAAGLSADQKEAVAKRLQAAGFGLPPAAASYSEKLAQDLKAKLQLGDGLSVRADRLAEVTVLLVDFVFKLEPLVWNTWRALSPRSSIRPPAGLKKTLGQFVGGDAAGPDQKFEPELRMLQRLVAAIVTAVGRVGKQFAKGHLARFSPSEISALVQMEHRSVFVSQEVQCWRKYVELAETLTEDSIEIELRKAIADYAESLIKGLDR